jgi:hypothetical protein
MGTDVYDSAGAGASVGWLEAGASAARAWKPSVVMFTAPACTSYTHVRDGIKLFDKAKLTARLRSSKRSSGSSIPTQSRMMSSGMFLSFLVFSSMLA